MLDINDICPNYQSENFTIRNECVVDERPLRYVTFYVGIAVLMFQTFLFVCVILKRKKLVHKLINAYAVNVLAIHLVNCLLYVINVGYGFVGRSTIDINPEQELVQSQSWLFMKSLFGTYILGMPFSLALLINAAQNDLFRIHRTVAGVCNDGSFEETKEDDNSNCKLLKNLKNRICNTSKKVKLTIIISINWILPLLISLLCFLDLSCLEACTCPYGYLLKVSNNTKLMQPCDCKECNVMWAPISRDMIIPYVIIGMLLVWIDVILLIRSVIKFRKFVQKHKKQTYSKRKQQKETDSIITRSRNENTRRSIRGIPSTCDNNSTNTQERNLRMLSHVDYDVSSDVVTIYSNNKQLSNNARRFEEDEKEKSKICEIEDVKHYDVMAKENPNPVANSSYEIVAFSNAFLHNRLKKNLMFLSLILILFCLGVGGSMVVTLILSFHPESIGDLDNLLVVNIPTVIFQGINALILCYTTSDLKLAILSPIRKLFYACRTVHYVKK